eukprot:m51a1_g13795 hypothetical protein (811) ;mRNA; f:345182-348500
MEAVEDKIVELPRPVSWFELVFDPQTNLDVARLQSDARGPVAAALEAVQGLLEASEAPAPSRSAAGGAPWRQSALAMAARTCTAVEVPLQALEKALPLPHYHKFISCPEAAHSDSPFLQTAQHRDAVRDSLRADARGSAPAESVDALRRWLAVADASDAAVARCCLAVRSELADAALMAGDARGAAELLREAVALLDAGVCAAPHCDAPPERIRAALVTADALASDSGAPWERFAPAPVARVEAARGRKDAAGVLDELARDTAARAAGARADQPLLSHAFRSEACLAEEVGEAGRAAAEHLCAVHYAAAGAGAAPEPRATLGSLRPADAVNAARRAVRAAREAGGDALVHRLVGAIKPQLLLALSRGRSSLLCSPKPPDAAAQRSPAKAAPRGLWNAVLESWDAHAVTQAARDLHVDPQRAADYARRRAECATRRGLLTGASAVHPPTPDDFVATLRTRHAPLSELEAVAAELMSQGRLEQLKVMARRAPAMPRPREAQVAADMLSAGMRAYAAFVESLAPPASPAQIEEALTTLVAAGGQSPSAWSPLSRVGDTRPLEALATALAAAESQQAALRREKNPQKKPRRCVHELDVARHGGPEACVRLRLRAALGPSAASLRLAVLERLVDVAATAQGRGADGRPATALGDAHYDAGRFDVALRYYLLGACLEGCDLGVPASFCTVIPRVVKCLTRIQAFVQAAAVCQLESPVRVAKALSLIRRAPASRLGTLNDSHYLGFFWEMPILEYLVYTHTQKLKTHKKVSLLMHVVGLPEANEYNGQDLRAPLIQGLRTGLMRCLIRDYLFQHPCQ